MRNDENTFLLMLASSSHQVKLLQDVPEADRTGWAADFADILMSDGTQTVLFPQVVHELL